MNRPVITDRTTINDLDPHVYDKKKFANLYWQLYRKRLPEIVWMQIKKYVENVQSKPRKKPVDVSWEDFKAAADLHNADTNMLTSLEWAQSVGLISSEELIEMKRKWRST